MAAAAAVEAALILEKPGEHTLDLPKPWSPPLSITRARVAAALAPSHMFALDTQAARAERWTPRQHARGATARATSFVDSARSRPALIVETFEARADKLTRRVRRLGGPHGSSSGGGVVEETFAAGRADGLARFTVDPRAASREFLFHPGARVDGLRRREEKCSTDTVGAVVSDYFAPGAAVEFRTIRLQSPAAAAAERTAEAAIRATIQHNTSSSSSSAAASASPLDTNNDSAGFSSTTIGNGAASASSASAAAAAAAALVAVNASAVLRAARLIYDNSPDAPGEYVVNEISVKLSKSGGLRLLPPSLPGAPPRELPECVTFSIADGTISVVFAKPAGTLVRTVHRYDKATGELVALASSAQRGTTLCPTAALVANADAATCLAALSAAEAATHYAAILTGQSVAEVIAARIEECAHVELELSVFDVAKQRFDEGRPLPDDEIVDDGEFREKKGGRSARERV